MDVIKEFQSAMIREIKKRPVTTNIGFGFLLFGFEQITDMEFLCPCNSEWNAVFALSFFCAPSLIFFLLVFNIKCLSLCSSKTRCQGESVLPVCEALLHSLVPAILWPVMLFLDGRYYVCLKTTWSGQYETIQSVAPLTWCKPVNSSQDFMTQTEEWHAKSQLIGLWMAAGLVLFYQICLFIISCVSSKKKEPEPGGADVERRQDEAAVAGASTPNTLERK